MIITMIILLEMTLRIKSQNNVVNIRSSCPLDKIHFSTILKINNSGDFPKKFKQLLNNFWGRFEINKN